MHQKGLSGSVHMAPSSRGRYHASVLVDGFAVGGYRSFGSGVQRVAPLSKLSLLVGQNNSGKSNVLRFLHRHYGELLEAAARPHATMRTTFEALDEHRPQSARLRFGVAEARDSEHFGQVANALSLPHQKDGFDKLLDALSDEWGLVWFFYRSMTPANNSLEFDPDWLATLPDDSGVWMPIWHGLTGRAGGVPTTWVNETLRAISPAQQVAPDVALVPAVRQVGQAALTDADYSGVDIIERLADLQHPAISEHHKKQRFREITDFARSVLDTVDVEIEIPVQRDTIHLSIGGKWLPIESLGTGIHEVMILAAAATVVTNHLVLIEEPELHLHPLLQRKLLAYLARRTSNQYVFTTHSAHLLEYPQASVLHVSLGEAGSTVTPAVTSQERLRICADLGYRASDLLQSNAVIWVEGPSDRVYIRWWLSAVAPHLVEGLHYSIMFYGGRLLSRLSANDPEVDDFIALRRINQYLAIVMDSDRSGPNKRINATKQRVRHELDGGAGVALVTRGREIENYVPWRQLGPTVKELHPSAVELLGSEDPYCRSIDYKTGSGELRTADKVKVAYKVSALPADLGVLDLNAWVTRLGRFVDEANGA